MSVARRIHFHALPEAVRRRFVERTAGREKQEPLYSQPQRLGLVPCFGFVAAAGLSLAAFYANGFGVPWSPEGIQQPYWLAAYALAGFALFRALLMVVRRLALRRVLPFRPGRYLFPLDLVEAEGEVLAVWPLSECWDVQLSHHRVKMIYYRSLLYLEFPKGQSSELVIYGQATAERVLEMLQASRAPMLHRLERVLDGQATNEELEFVSAHDPFLELRTSGAWDTLSETPLPEPGRDALARPLPWLLRHATAVAVVLAVGLAVPLWTVRNQRSDDAMWQAAQESFGSTHVEDYLRHGRAHREEASALLAQRKAAEAAAAAANAAGAAGGEPEGAGAQPAAAEDAP